MIRFSELFDRDLIKLRLEGTSKNEILHELISLLGLDEEQEAGLFAMLRRRQNIGSTGIGRGIAVVYCRSLYINRLRLGFGRQPDGIDFKAIDDEPVYHFFLALAPPLEETNLFLPVLGKVARLAKDREVPELLSKVETPEGFLELMDSRGV